MKKLLILLSFIAGTLFLLNCGNSTPEIIPTAEFTHERQFVEPGVVVEFVNASTDADSFVWDFDDGNTSTEREPNHSYTATGRYIVTLTVTSTTGQTAQYTSNVSVGIRCMSGWAIESVEFENPENQPWDEDDGPDVLWGFAPSTAAQIEWNELGTDLVADDFPIYKGAALKRQGGTGGFLNIPLTDEDWTFSLLDNDVPFSDVEGASQVMASFELNPLEEEPDLIDYNYGSGYFRVTSGGYSFIVEFEFIIF